MCRRKNIKAVFKLENMNWNRTLLICKIDLFTPWILMNCWWLLYLIFQLWRVWQCKCWTTWLHLSLFLQSCREFYRWVSEEKKLLPSCATQLLGRAISRLLKTRFTNCLVQSISVEVQLVRYKLEKLIEWPGRLDGLRRHVGTHRPVRR